jgi:Rne/Rng family ribonuclease
MNKEMFISSSPHETKVAVCEDGQLVEVYFERDTDVGLVGGIYKGRVNRVLPGMQSAFVDIGLERDAFLYVSDFSLQDQDEFEGVLNESQTRGATIEVEQRTLSSEAGSKPIGPAAQQPEGAGEVETGVQQAPEAVEPPAQAESPAANLAEQTISEPSSTRQPTPAGEPSGEERGFGRRSHRGRRRRRHGRGGFADRHQDRHFEAQPTAPRPETVAESTEFEILPGESLAKYRHAAAEAPSAPEAASQTRVEEEVAEQTAAAEGTEAETAEHTADAVQNWEGQQPEAAPEEPETKLHEEVVAWEYPHVSGPKSETEEWQAGETVADEPEEDNGAEEVAESEEQSETEILAEVEQVVPEPVEGVPEPAERSYTLREPHERPHFAPRRGRRGRRRGGRHARRNESRERESARPSGQQGLLISELLKEGQEIIVQIAKEPLGTKGARITSHIALPGRYVVYMPTISHVGVSRKISSEQERLRLRNIVLEHKGSLTGGFIVRTAGEGHSEEEIKADLKYLTSLWNDIRTRAEQVKAPALLYRDLDLAQRLMRDLVTPEFKTIWLDNETEYERAVDFVNRLQPSLVGRVKLHTKATPLFEEHGIQDEIEKALKPKVWLKSGGYIVINQTEALVAIDVNTGKYVGKTNRLEDTIVKTNIDAVNEIVRQIRLRDLGGIIVIDFIDMDERRNRNKVVQALEEALRRDRAPTKVLSFNDFGLVAVTRKRVKQSLERTLCDPCTYCNGSGWVKSPTTICYEILAEARKMAGEIEGKTMTLRVNPEVALALKSRDGLLVREIEELTRKNIVVKSDPTIHQERFEIF